MKDAFEPVTANGWSDPATDAAEWKQTAEVLAGKVDDLGEQVAERDATILSLRREIFDLQQDIKGRDILDKRAHELLSSVGMPIDDHNTEATLSVDQRVECLVAEFRDLSDESELP